MKYFLWRSDHGDEFCVVDQPDIEKSWQVTDGVPRLETQIEPIICKMSATFPKNIRLSDNLYGSTLAIISSKVKDKLSEVTTNPIEYLPVTVVNHKGRKEPEEYFVLHPLNLIDCIDIAASGVEWNRISPTQISRCQSLVLKEDMLADLPNLFRPKGWGRNLLVRQDLKELLETSGFSGLRFKPAEEYKGIG